MPKVTKKSARKVESESIGLGSKQLMVSTVVVVSTVIIAPIAWYMFDSILILFLVPAIASLLAAVMFKQVTGKVMTEGFRRETTTTTAVFAVILSVLAALNLPKLGLDGKPDVVLPVFMILYMSLWAIVGVLVTVYLPLGITIPKKK